MSNVKVIVPVTGSIWKLLCDNGDTVTDGQKLMIIESMKTEFTITAPVTGKVTGLTVSEGTAVDEDVVVCEIDEG